MERVRELDIYSRIYLLTSFPGVLTASTVLNVTSANSTVPSLPSTTEILTTPGGAIVVAAGIGTGRGLLIGEGNNLKT